MKKAIRNRWVKALRSSEYKQAVTALRDGKGGMCCLGVLCDITQKETGGEWDVKGRFGNGTDSSSGVLPNFVAEKLGISRHSYYGNNNQLSADNDRGKDFIEIANIIEAHF